MRKTSWRRGDKTPTVVLKSWRRSTPSVDDCGFVAVSRWYAAWEILSRDKAWPVEYRGGSASRARASRKIGRGRQSGHLGGPGLCAEPFRAPTHPLSPSVGGSGKGRGVCRLPTAQHQHDTRPVCNEAYRQWCWPSSAHKQLRVWMHQGK